MSLEEAIAHTKEKIAEQIECAHAVESRWGCDVTGYSIHSKCAEEHKQLLEWLEELKKRREADGHMLTCPCCGLDVHSDFNKCPRCGGDIHE